MNANEAGIAAILSFLFNGLGQIYNGQIRKGLVIMFFSAIGMITVLIGAIILGYSLLVNPPGIFGLILGFVLLVLGTVAIAILGIYNIYDAYNVAKRKE